MGERWTVEAVLRESGRWVHVPRGGRCIEDERRLLVHLPRRWGTTRVWRSWVPDEEGASDLIEETVGEVRAAGGGRILWHTGDRVAPPFMDECLATHGFRTTEKLEVLAYFLVNGQVQRLPWIGVPEDLTIMLVRDAHVLGEALCLDSEVFRSPPPAGGEYAEYAGELEKLRHHERRGSSHEGVSLAVRFAAYLSPSPPYGVDNPGGIVAGAQVVGKTLRLWGAATRQTFRGRGAYGALVLERCRFGRHLGATLALAKANVATSGSILKRAGLAPNVATCWRSTAKARGAPAARLGTGRIFSRDNPGRRAVIIGLVAEKAAQQFSGTDLAMMRHALLAAEDAAEKGEVPVGAVVARGAEVLAIAANEREASGDPTSHAELLAIRRASTALGGWRLTDCTLYATLEPCPMCAGAAHAARLSRLVFAAPDPKAGYAGTLHNTLADVRLNHTLKVQEGLLADDAASLLRDFFRNRRHKPG